MAEIYLITAETNIYLNEDANTTSFINKVYEHAKINPFTDNIAVQNILDERACELCDEYFAILIYGGCTSASK